MAQLSFGLTDKPILITGGSRGIGFEVARLLLAEGALVTICARKPEGLAAAAEKLGSPDNLLAVPAHVGKPEDVENLFEAAEQRFGKLYGLVNNVGMNIASMALDADRKLYEKIIETNLHASFFCARKAALQMKEKRIGRIVSITSIAAHKSSPFMGIYGIAKAGIEMMTKVLAHELAPSGIMVNALAPSMVKTDFSKPFWGNKEVHDNIALRIPLGRLAEVDDIAFPVLFLLSDAARFITGQTLVVDGGATIV